MNLDCDRVRNPITMNIETIDTRPVPSIIDHTMEKPQILIIFQSPSNFSFLP